MRTKAYNLILIMTLGVLIFMLNSDVSKEKPVVVTKKEMIFNKVHFKRCMKRSQTAGKSLKTLKKECKNYAEIAEGKLKAVAKCTKWKNEEIDWTKEEIDLYCNKQWRGYR